MKNRRLFNRTTGVTSVEPFWARKSAERQLCKIRTEIDEGYFNPKHWMPDSPMTTKVYEEEWLDCIFVSNKTLKDCRSSVNNNIVPFFGDKDIRRIRYNDLVKFYNWIPGIDKSKYNVMSVLKTCYGMRGGTKIFPKFHPFRNFLINFLK